MSVFWVRSLTVKQFSDKEQSDGSTPSVPTLGRLAQLARAPRLHRGGQGFKSLSGHRFPAATVQKRSPTNDFIRGLDCYTLLYC